MRRDRGWAAAGGIAFVAAFVAAIAVFAAVVPYVVASVLMFTRDVDPTLLTVMLGVGFLLELPQVARALTGRHPMRIIPFDLLPE